jgi:hypothetical protein
MEYIITFKTVQGRVLLKYDTRGFLNDVKIEADMLKSQHEYIWQHLPLYENELSAFKLQGKGKVMIELAPVDLSFDNFWNLYDYKVGKKDRTIKLWDALDEVDKVKCINSIPKYNKWLSTRSTERLYAETYLNQARYNSEF